MDAANWATLTISVLSLVLSVLVFVRGWRWKKEASWLLTYLPHNWPKKWKELNVIDGEEPTYVAELSNIGDGTAYDVSISGIDCRTAMLSIDGDVVEHREFLPRFDNDSTAYVAIWLERGKQRFVPGSAVRIHWVHSPTRLQRCGVQVIPVRQFENGPRCGTWTTFARINGKLQARRQWRSFHKHPELSNPRPDNTLTGLYLNRSE